MGHPSSISRAIPSTKQNKNSLGEQQNTNNSDEVPMAYRRAVRAIHAATNLGLGFLRRMKTPLKKMPIPITPIPPIPKRRKGEKPWAKQEMDEVNVTSNNE